VVHITNRVFKFLQGPNTGEQAPSTPRHTGGGGSTALASIAGVSTDKNMSYTILAGTLAGQSALGWYLLSKPKKTEEVID
jgi:hypothetical protein